MNASVPGATEAPRRLAPSQESFLDAVRGLAALTVLAGHTFSHVRGDFAFGKNWPWQSLAVVVFFWLSGFLIAYHCMTRPAYRWGDYLIDRFSRIYVLFLPALVFTLLVTWDAGRGSPWWQWTGTALMLHHIPFQRIWEVLPTIPNMAVNSALWTIAVEWWLYVGFGILYFAARAGSRGRWGMAVLAVPAAAACGYFLLKEYIAWAWVLGAASAALFLSQRAWRTGAAWAVAVVALAAFVIRLRILGPPGVLVNMYDLQLMLVVAVGLYALLLTARDWPIGAWQGWAGRLAFVSYAVYLLHEPLRNLLSRRLFSAAENALTTPLQGLALVLVCLVLSAIAAGLLEERHLQLRRWWKLRRGLAAPTVGETRAAPGAP